MSNSVPTNDVDSKNNDVDTTNNYEDPKNNHVDPTNNVDNNQLGGKKTDRLKTL